MAFPGFIARKIDQLMRMIRHRQRAVLCQHIHNSRNFRHVQPSLLTASKRLLKLGSKFNLVHYPRHCLNKSAPSFATKTLPSATSSFPNSMPVLRLRAGFTVIPSILLSTFRKLGNILSFSTVKINSVIITTFAVNNDKQAKKFYACKKKQYSHAKHVNEM